MKCSIEKCKCIHIIPTIRILYEYMYRYVHAVECKFVQRKSLSIIYIFMFFLDKTHDCDSSTLYLCKSNIRLNKFFKYNRTFFTLFFSTLSLSTLCYSTLCLSVLCNTIVLLSILPYSKMTFFTLPYLHYPSLLCSTLDCLTLFYSSLHSSCTVSSTFFLSFKNLFFLLSSGSLILLFEVTYIYAQLVRLIQQATPVDLVCWMCRIKH